MQAHVTIGHRIFDLKKAMDISIPISFSDSVSAFGVATPKKNPYQVNSFIGDVGLGGSCNCHEITINPHCHGTHTECVGHILSHVQTVPVLIKPFFGIAQLVTFEVKGISKNDLQKITLDSDVEALIIRTMPNPTNKKNQTYTDAAYMEVDAIKYCNEYGIKHLLVDFPSVDPIEDGGHLLAHRAFWHVEPGQITMSDNVAEDKSITELIYVPNEIHDGIYALNIQISNMELDGVPSRPLLYPEIV